MRTSAALFFLALSGCAGGGEPAAPEAKEIVIGQYGSLTGPEATFGISTKNGIELATEEVNARGGIFGMKVRMVVEDDQGKPEETASAVSKILSRDRPVALLGEVASTLSLTAAPLAQNASVPMISPSSTNPKVTEVGDYIFRVCFIDPFQGTAIAKFAYNSKNVRKVAILKDVKSDYSQGLGQFFAETFTKLGGTIVAEEAYAKGDLDFKAQLTKVIATGPEAIFIPGYYTDVGLIAKQARQLNYTGLLLGGDGWDSVELAKVGEDAIVGGFFTNHYSTDDPNPTVQDFIKRYQAKYGQKPDGLAALGYDAAKVLYSAIEGVAADPAMAAALGDRSSTPATEASRKKAREAIRDRLTHIADFNGVTGSITIDPNRNAQKPAVVVEVLRDAGQYRFVEAVYPDGMTAPSAAPAGGTVEGGATPGAPAPGGVGTPAGAPEGAAPAAPAPTGAK